MAIGGSIPSTPTMSLAPAMLLTPVVELVSAVLLAPAVMLMPIVLLAIAVLLALGIWGTSCKRGGWRGGSYLSSCPIFLICNLLDATAAGLFDNFSGWLLSKLLSGSELLVLYSSGFSTWVLLMLSPYLGNFSIPWGMSCSAGIWMPGAAFRVLQSTTFPNFSSTHTIRHIV